MRRWLTIGWISVFVFAVSGAAVVLVWHHWEALADGGSEAIRNIGLVAGGVIAVGLALWRSTIAERQAEAAEHDSLDGQFQRAVEMLGHEMVSVRVGGVVALHNLATRHFDRYGWQVCRILDAFTDSRRKGASGVDDGDAGFKVERDVGGTYRGTLDGAQAFEAFWDIQGNLGKLTGRNRRRRAKWRRFLKARGSAK